MAHSPAAAEGGEASTEGGEASVDAGAAAAAGGLAAEAVAALSIPGMYLGEIARA